MQFALHGAVTSCRPYGFGHINKTFLVITAQGRRYILQRINERVFDDIAGLMRNIELVTRCIAGKTNDPRGVLRPVLTREQDIRFRGAADRHWRIYDFVEDSLCLQAPDIPEDFYQSAVAFGTFQRQLSDFPAHTLRETIPDFRNTPERFRKLRAAEARNAAGRAVRAAPELEAFLLRETGGTVLHRKRLSGELPLRVTHLVASLLATVPIVVLFSLIEKHLTSGLTSGGVKG